MASMIIPISCNPFIIYPLLATPQSVKIAVECLEQTKANILTLTPPRVEEIGQGPAILN